MMGDDNMFWKLLYWLIARRLPKSDYPLGYFGRFFRSLCAKHFIKSIGHNVNIEQGAIFSTLLSLSDNACVGINARLDGDVRIGKHSMMGPDCMIFTQNHVFDKENLIYIPGYTPSRPVIIEDNVWIGARVIILPGVTIGKGSTVGAGAVVSKSIPPYSVAVGNPARVVKSLLPQI
jgi:maltose O-acetyltransferase